MSEETDQPKIPELTGDLGFEWDESKRQHNISKHGIDFADALFALPRAMLLPARNVSGEKRGMAISELNGDVITIIYTLRAGSCRLISARRARDNERGRYQTLHARRDPEDG